MAQTILAVNLVGVVLQVSDWAFSLAKVVYQMTVWLAKAHMTQQKSGGAVPPKAVLDYWFPFTIKLCIHSYIYIYYMYIIEVQ